MPTEIKTAALEYLQKGFSVIPIGRDKKPLIKWQEYQKEKPTNQTIESWFNQFPEANIAIVTGDISGLVVVDVEAGGSVQDLPPTAIVKTGGGGWHFYYKHPGQVVKNAVRLRDKLDVRGDGGFVVVPPSTHRSGRQYEWTVGLESTDLAELPLWILEKCSEGEKKETNWGELLNSKIGEGSRNMTAAQIAGKVLYHLPTEVWEISGWATLKEWNATNNKPPLGENELRTVWESIQNNELKKRTRGETGEEQKPPRKSQSDQLIEIIENNEQITLFRNETKTAFLSLPVQDHLEIWPCRSKIFKQWLGNYFWKTERKTIYSEALNTAINVIEGKAFFEGCQHTLNNRVAWHEDAIWYDLADKDWRAIKISSQGWEIDNRPPILFRRYSHQRPQASPSKGGNIKTFLNFINISDEGQKLILLVYLVSCFIPDIPHPVLIIYGDQGSAKSTLSKLLRRLVDPSVIQVSEFPQNSAELIQKLSHHWFVFFDNISHLSGSISDILCKAVTGGGFTKRELYSDDDDVIYTFRRCVGLNGINLVAAKPDLLDRSILFELERIPKDKRRLEKEIFVEFEKETPGILGDVFNIISRAMRIRSETQSLWTESP